MGQRTKRKRRRHNKGPRPPKPPRATTRPAQRPREAARPAPITPAAELPAPASVDAPAGLPPRVGVDAPAEQRFADMLDAALVLDGAALLDLALGACASTFHLATRAPGCAALLEAVAEDLEEARYNGGYLLDRERLRHTTDQLAALVLDAATTDAVVAARATLTAGTAALRLAEDDLTLARHDTIAALQLARLALPARQLPELLEAVGEHAAETLVATGGAAYGLDCHADCPCGGVDGTALHLDL